MAWRSLSRSVIGTRHQRQSLPCQDAGAYRDLGEVVIGAIADGAGSAPHSELGATLAVKRTLEYLSNLEAWLQPSDNPQWPTLERPPLPSQARRLFERTVNQVNKALQQEADRQGYGLDTLACTLLGFVATPHWVAAMQIGDGFIVVSTPSAPYELMFVPDKGEFANQTMFVTAATIPTDLQTKVVPSAPQFLCAASDAFERIALHLPSWKPHPGFFKPLEEYLSETPDPEQEDTYLVNFLGSEYLNKQTEDDKTLLLSLYQCEEED
jgi:Protein phosphatase 2C